jgi:hypothetical protein
MSKLNVDRMRKRVNVPRPDADEEPEGIVVRDAVGRIIRVLPVPRGNPKPQGGGR